MCPHNPGGCNSECSLIAVCCLSGSDELLTQISDTQLQQESIIDNRQATCISHNLHGAHL